MPVQPGEKYSYITTMYKVIEKTIADYVAPIWALESKNYFNSSSRESPKHLYWMLCIGELAMLANGIGHGGRSSIQPINWFTSPHNTNIIFCCIHTCNRYNNKTLFSPERLKQQHQPLSLVQSDTEIHLLKIIQYTEFVKCIIWQALKALTCVAPTGPHYKQ